ncbi:Cut8-domain-containing protein [Basidiobolus meristosporus CBS 931.73]|uniref:Tethering factor for nuclear proteasome STS1 n=1 Tax=Basidiobolus meristosporus CBS 931.73 TaxID=1314790 RepID=A0A1Y1YZQ1_9FUNG|nr:Cut8-domain-containing protein [Basidiobolus meristosporus CBS 931.73]|eukprot:ORY03533.1 Cut8-domain-containing protein [Basidiobolus meristosporus CBS 931.73]
MSEASHSPCFPVHSPQNSPFHQRPLSFAPQRSPIIRNIEFSRGRKRKTSFDENMRDDDYEEDSDTAANIDEMDQYNPVKKLRSSLTRHLPLNKLLEPLDKSQLISVLSQLVDNHPHLKNEISSYVPKPTIQSVTNLLSNLEKKLQESFPYSKFGPGRDPYTFNRVHHVLVEIQDAILEYACHFTSEEEFPTTTFSYLHTATSVIHRLPNWDDPKHQKLKNSLYARIAIYWRKAIEDAASKLGEGRIYGQLVVGEWARNLDLHNTESNGTFADAVEDFKTKLGWIIGIVPAHNFAQARIAALTGF